MFEACFLLYAVTCVHSLYINSNTAAAAVSATATATATTINGIIANSNNKMHGANIKKMCHRPRAKRKSRMSVAYPFKLVYYMYHTLWFSKNGMNCRQHILWIWCCCQFFVVALPHRPSLSSLASMLQYFTKWLRFLFHTLHPFCNRCVSFSRFFLFSPLAERCAMGCCVRSRSKINFSLTVFIW